MKSSSTSASKQQIPKLQKATTVENIPPFQMEQNKITQLESHLNRVCLQQDALMPLLQMIEYIPSIQRTDSVVKGLLRKMEENESKLTKHDKLFEKKFRENTLGPENGDKGPKKTQKQVEDISNKVKDIEGQMNNLYRWYECKLKEESQQLQRNMDQKLEKQKTDMQRSFFNETTKTHSKTTSAVLQSADKNLLQAFEGIMNSQLQGLRHEMQGEIDSLREEVAHLRSQQH